MYIPHKFAHTALTGTLNLIVMAYHCRNRLNLGTPSFSLPCRYPLHKGLGVEVTSESDPFPDSALPTWLFFLAEEFFSLTI